MNRKQYFIRNFVLANIFLLYSVFVQANVYKFPDEFLFGIASAPAHAEDNLEDSWIDWAKAGHVRAFDNTSHPAERLQFWSKPEVEIEYAAQLGVQVYRLGIDWGRFYGSTQPLTKHPDFIHFKKIVKLIKSKNMKVMLTLFHHSHPKEDILHGGWIKESTVSSFSKWALEVIGNLQEELDYVITFNEPNIYNLMTFAMGAWPNGGYDQGTMAHLNLGFYKGNYVKAMENMIKAHRFIYRSVKETAPKISIGIAQHFAFFLYKNGERNFLAKILYRYFNLSFLDEIKNDMDFVGVNYYGAEYFGLFKSEILQDKEYSEAGRAIYANGLFEILKENQQRYGKAQFITENGIADSTDWIRPSYLYEHLSAIEKAHKSNIPVIGYIFWTLSDNWEWSDGYCPKFGLLEVRREQNMKRYPRASFEIYKGIVQSKTISRRDREQHWGNYLSKKSYSRPFCRSSDGVNGLDSPSPRPIIGNDWRFSDSDL